MRNANRTTVRTERRRIRDAPWAASASLRAAPVSDPTTTTSAAAAVVVVDVVVDLDLTVTVGIIAAVVDDDSGAVEAFSWSSWAIIIIIVILFDARRISHSTFHAGTPAFVSSCEPAAREDKAHDVVARCRTITDDDDNDDDDDDDGTPHTAPTPTPPSRTVQLADTATRLGVATGGWLAVVSIDASDADVNTPLLGTTEGASLGLDAGAALGVPEGTSLGLTAGAPLAVTVGVLATSSSVAMETEFSSDSRLTTS
jgi:hypothetical protein